jgi:hypothetical protein
MIGLGEKRYVEMSEAEQFVLTLSKGFGKRTSSYGIVRPTRRQRHRRHVGDR